MPPFPTVEKAVHNASYGQVNWNQNICIDKQCKTQKKTYGSTWGIAFFFTQENLEPILNKAGKIMRKLSSQNLVPQQYFPFKVFLPVSTPGVTPPQIPLAGALPLAVPD